MCRGATWGWGVGGGVGGGGTGGGGVHEPLSHFELSHVCITFVAPRLVPSGPSNCIEQLQRNVLTYTTKHKQKLNTSAFDKQSSSSARR